MTALEADRTAPPGPLAHGALAAAPAPMPVLALIAKGLTIRGYTFKEIVLDDARRERAMRFVVGALASGKFHPVIAKVFPFDAIAEAHRYLESNEQFGKVVVTTDRHM